MILDEGYGFISSQYTEDGKFKVIQIKKDFLKRFEGIFEAEEDGNVYGKEERQAELDEVFDFAISFLADVLDPANHKIEILTKEEFTERHMPKPKPKEGENM